MKNKYVIQLGKVFFEGYSIKGRFWFSKEEEEATWFTNKREAERTAKKFGGTVKQVKLEDLDNEVVVPDEFKQILEDLKNNPPIDYNPETKIAFTKDEIEDAGGQVIDKETHGPVTPCSFGDPSIEMINLEGEGIKLTGKDKTVNISDESIEKLAKAFEKLGEAFMEMHGGISIEAQKVARHVDNELKRGKRF